MSELNKKVDPVSELICELTRNCNIKEEYFAASFNLSPTEVRLLKLFAFASSYSIKDIRTKLNLTPGRITHILSSLEDKKLVARVQDENDRRNIEVKLLPKAAPLILNLHQNYSELHRQILQNVNDQELEKILSSLQILVEVFRNWVDKK